MGADAHSSCHRCGRMGHIARECNIKTCFRCNGRGHMAWECTVGVVCSGCGETGHLQRNCRNVSCHRCGRKGHIAKFCSDPFARAAEMERMERQQAVVAARAVQQQERWSSTGTYIRQTGLTAGPPPPSGPPSPWDGLGRSFARAPPVFVLRPAGGAPVRAGQAAKVAEDGAVDRRGADKRVAADLEGEVEERPKRERRDEGEVASTGGTKKDTASALSGLMGYGSEEEEEEEGVGAANNEEGGREAAAEVSIMMPAAEAELEAESGAAVGREDVGREEAAEAAELGGRGDGEQRGVVGQADNGRQGTDGAESLGSDRQG